MALKADVERRCRRAQRRCNDANADVMDQERKKLSESCYELDEVDRASNDLDEIDERIDGTWTITIISNTWVLTRLTR
jgi:hypothetical protein